MIHSRITAKSQTTIPRAVRAALGVGPGDELAYEIEGDRVVVRRMIEDADDDGVFDNPFALFTEWASEADAAYDGL